MKDKRQTKQQLTEEITALRAQVATLQTKQDTFELNRKFLTLLYAGAAVASSLDLNYVLETVTLEMANLLQVEACTVFEWSKGTATITVMRIHDWEQRDGRKVGQIFNTRDFPRTQETLLERHAQHLVASETQHNSEEWLYMQNNGAKTLLLLPMEFQDHVVGLVELYDSRREIQFDSQEIAFAQLLANQTASAIRNARLYAQVRRELAERVELEQKLRQAGSRNQAILDAIPDTMVYLNRQGQILDYKLASGDDLAPGVLHQPRLQNDKADTFELPAQLISELRTHLPLLFNSGKMQIFGYQGASLLGLQDFEVRLVVSGPDEALGLIRNMTGQKQAERQALRTERLTALGRLAAALAHEINNPLQAIQSHLDLMLNFPLDPGESEKYLQIIREEIQRLAEITENVLGYAHPPRLPTQPVYVDQIVLRVLTLIRKQLDKSGLLVTTDFREASPVLAVPHQLTQIFFNLLMNAIEAMGNSGQVIVAVYPDNDEVAISFTNDGPSIPADILPRIFDPFFTTKPEGSGMGLWISHNLVKQLSGSLVVENLGEEQGIIFTVRLPAASNKF